MKDSIWLLRKTLLSMRRNYKSLLVYMVAPILGIVIAYLTYGGDQSSALRVGIANLDGGEPVAEGVASFLEGVAPLEVSLVQHGAEAEEGVLSGELDAALVIPQGFSLAVREGRAGAEAELLALEGAGAAPYVKEMLALYMENLMTIAAAAPGDAAKFDERYARYKEASVEGYTLSATEVRDRSAQRDMTNGSIGYLIVFMMFAAVNLSAFMIKERENRTYYRLLTSPASSRAYVASNVAANLMLMMLKVALVLAVMSLGFGIDPGIPLWQLALALFLFAWVAIGLSLLIVAFSRSAMYATALQNMLIIPSCLLAGCMFPVEALPSPLRVVADLLPQRWLLETIEQLQAGASGSTIAVHGLTLLAFALTFSLAAAYKFGRNRDTRTFI